MDAKYFREKAEFCLRLADGLSLNNPGRFQLIDLAEDFRQRAKELEMKRHSNSNAARRYTAQPSLEQAIFERQNPAGIQLLSDQYI
jgi:hypothetical protein